MASNSENRGRVLLVEDEAMICDIAEEALVEQGFEVRAVATAGEALSCLRSGPHIDVLFTDVNLAGGMDGQALAKEARQLQPDLPVMYTSGRQSRIEHLDPVTGSLFIPKPYNPFDLGRLLEYLVSSKMIMAPFKRGAA